MKKNIPNFITLLNLTYGLVALYFVFNQEWEKAFLFLFLGIFFDFIDGFVARKLQVSSDMGLQLDSLADMVTSGVVPTFVLFFMIQNSLGLDKSFDFTSLQSFLPAISFAVAMGSAWRLAVFNTDERQAHDFVGLPTPANALFIASLPLVMQQTDVEWIKNILSNPWVLSAIALISAYLLNMNLKLFSLKFKDFSWSYNKEKYILLLISVVLLIALKIIAVPLIIFIYILMSFIKDKTSKN